MFTSLRIRSINLTFCSIVMAGVIAFATTASAATFTWDAGGTHPTSPNDGSGFWDTTAANWSNGATDAGWTAGSNAVIGRGQACRRHYHHRRRFWNGQCRRHHIQRSRERQLHNRKRHEPDADIIGHHADDYCGRWRKSDDQHVNCRHVRSNIDWSRQSYSHGFEQLHWRDNHQLGHGNRKRGRHLGATTGALVLGNTAGTLATSANVAINTSATIGSFNDTTQTATDTLVIANGQTLTVNGAFTVGQVVSNSTANMVLNSYSGADVPGSGGTLTVNGAMTVGANPGGGTKITTTVDLSALSAFNLTGTALNIGNGTNIKGLLTLASGANSANFINVATINIGNSEGGNTNSGSTLSLGTGTNTIQANAINIGASKSAASLVFLSSSGGSVLITGTAGGVSTANITLGNETSGTGSSPSSLSLAGHSALVQAGTVIIGRDGGAAGTANAAITFDTGTFNVANLQFGVGASGTVTNLGGSFTLGSNSASTGVLNVTSTFLLADNTGVTTGTATGTFAINGGTANIAANIVDASTATHPSNTTLKLNGGTLNMSGFAIGTAAAPITNVNLVTNSNQTATLTNLGGTGINGAGLTMNGAGTLTLAGSNSYSGSTTVSSGTLIVTGTTPAAMRLLLIAVH